MKKIVFISLLLTLSASSLFSQVVTGSWYGVLETPMQKLSVEFNIQQSNGQYSATMSIPEQGMKDFKVTATTFSSDTLTLGIPRLNFVYKGAVGKDGQLKGKLTQHGMDFDLDLSRAEVAKKVNRPQEPKPPYPYISEDVTFRNEGAGISLGGTITIPEGGGKHPAVVLVSGSGLQNRDEEVFDHKPFLVLSDYLTRNGIVVLRYDDRSFGESEGNPANATTADFAEDAMAGIRYLMSRKEVNPNQVGIIGHSEGGLIAFMLAAKEKDIAFAIPMAGSTLRGDSILSLQNEAIGRGYGMTAEALAMAGKINRSVYDVVLSSNSKEEVEEKLAEILGTSERAKGQIKQMSSSWMRFFLGYDPSEDIQNIYIPILVLFGDKDLQVLAEQNAEAFKKNIPDTNKHTEVKIYSGKNHLFQSATTGLSTEYYEIEETISPEVLQDITGWIKKVTR